MSRTPETITCNVRKFFYNALVKAGHCAVVLTLIAWLAGGSWLFFMFLAMFLYGASSKVVYEWEKVFEQGVFRPKR